MKNGDIELSVCVTAHHEGIIAHKTMLSIFRALELLEKENIKYEIVVHIDNGDEATKNYFSRYKDDPRFRIFENSFGDPGPSRNFAIKKARGMYVATLDGDDLISSNYFSESIHQLHQADQDIILHPKVDITFGNDKKHVINIKRDSYDESTDAVFLCAANFWGAPAVAKRKIFLQTPYRDNSGGFGYEDYQFSCDTRAKGVEHRVTNDSVLFYRQKITGSVLSQHSSERSTLSYSPLFDISFFQSFEIPEKCYRASKCTKKSLSKTKQMYIRIRNNKIGNFVLEPVADVLKKITNKKYIDDGNKLPDFVIEAWKEANVLESQLYPTGKMLRESIVYNSEDEVIVGITYHQLVQNIKKLPDYVMIVPWLAAGGADKVALNYVNALLELHPSWHIVMITTIEKENTWKDKLPKNVYLLDFGNLTKNFSDIQKDDLLCRLLIQLKCKRIHIINSLAGFKWIINHPKVANLYEIYVSIFNKTSNSKRIIWDFSDRYLSWCYPHVKHIFCDNENFINVMHEHDAFDLKKMSVHYQPIATEITKPVAIKKQEDKHHVLWAGRVAPEKLPGVLKGIGKILPDNVVIDVYGEPEPQYKDFFAEKCPGIVYHGGYNGFKSLPIEKFDLFLFTSYTEGMPNTILEATAAGLPIVASDAGGVKEFIQNCKTGLLITDKLKARAYAEAIEEMLENPDKAHRYVKAAQKLLQESHSWKHFVEDVERDIK